MASRVALLAGDGEMLLIFRGPLLQAWRARGHEVHVLAPGIPAAVRQQLDEWGVHWHEVRLSRVALNPFSDLWTFLLAWWLLLRLRPDCVLTYHIKMVIWGGFAARLALVTQRYAMITGAGYAFMDGGGFRQLLAHGMARALYRLVLNSYRAVFFQNPDDRELFLQLRLLDGPQRARLINGSGVDLAHYSVTPLPQAPVFLMIARLLADKGVREYVAAARELKARHPQCRFLLVGARDENPACISQAELDGWLREGVVEYRGWLPDVRPVLREALVYVLPSYYREGVPKTVLEAMAMGRPVVTTDAPGCRETVRAGGNGLLVPVRDVPALVAALERFVREPELALRMGAESRLRAESRFDVHKVNQVILETMGL